MLRNYVHFSLKLSQTRQGAKQTFPYSIDEATDMLLVNKALTYLRLNKEEYALIL